MSRRNKFSVIEKLEIIDHYEKGIIGISEIEKKYTVNCSTVYDWISIYKRDGIIGLEVGSNNNSYSPEIKKAAVLAYLSGEGSLREITLKYGLKDKFTLRSWIKKYNGHEELKSYNPVGCKNDFLCPMLSA